MCDRDSAPLACEHGYTEGCPDCDAPAYMPGVLARADGARLWHYEVDVALITGVVRAADDEAALAAALDDAVDQARSVVAAGTFSIRRLAE